MKIKRLFLRAVFVVLLSFFATTLFAADLPSWIQLIPTDPSPMVREESVAVFDSTNNRMIIHGGMGPYCCSKLSDVWVLTNADGSESTLPSWTQLLPTNPLTRTNHAAVYNPSSNKMITFGGENGSSVVTNEVWVLSNANGKGGNPEWVKTVTCGVAPTPRFFVKAVYDSATNRMVVFGGANSSTYYNETWILTNADRTEAICSSWIKLPTTGTLPAARGDQAVVYDNTTNRMIMFGGHAYGASENFNDVWILTNANGVGGDSAWIKVSPTGSLPAPRYYSAVGYDSLSNQMIIFGGTNNTVSYGDTWGLTNANGTETTAPAWVNLNIQGTSPSARSQLGSAYSSLKNRLIIFAGDRAPSCCSYLNETWVLTLSNPNSYNLNTQSILNLDFATNYDAKNAKNVELKNTSAKPITVSNVIISNAASYWVNLFVDNKLTCRAKYYLSYRKNFTIPANSSCNISIGFSPFKNLTAGKPIAATLTLKTTINGIAIDKVINLTGLGRKQVANFYNSDLKLQGLDTWAVSELKGGNLPINTSLVGAANGYDSAKFWYGSVIDPTLKKNIASVGHLVVFAENSENPSGHVGVVIQKTPVLTMLSMNDIRDSKGVKVRRWSVRPVNWYGSKATWSPLITGLNATNAAKHYGFIDWRRDLY